MINKITLKKGVRIVNNEYVIKNKKASIKNTYNYLLSRSFDYFPEIIKEDDNYIYYKYVDDIIEPKEQKIIDLIALLSLLHNKTTFYKEIDIDYYKEIYEEINYRIDNTYDYYNHLMDNIDNEIYMSPANYLIARNVSLIYESLNYSKENIDKWYQMIENKREVRLVMVHNNLELNHYLKSDKPYLISWDNSTTNMPIYDLISLYKHNYLDFEFNNIFKIYLNKYPLMDEEMYLFLILISIPDKIIEQDSEYKTVLGVRRLIDYLYKTNELRKEYSISKKTNERNKQDK